MAVDGDNLDELNLDLNVRNTERWDTLLKDAEQSAESAAIGISSSFAASEIRVDQFGKSLLSLQQRTATLGSNFQKLSTAEFGKDLEFINVKASENVLKLGQLNEKLIGLEANLAGRDLDKGKFDRLTQEIRTEIGLLERELILLRQVQTLQATASDPRIRAPITYNDIESKDLLSSQTQLKTLESGFVRLRDVNVSKGITLLSDKANSAILKIAELKATVGALDKQLIGQTDKTVISQITSQAKVAHAEIQLLKRELISLQSQSPGGGSGGGGGGGNLGAQVGRGLGLPFFGSGLGVAAAVGTAYLAIERGLDLSKQALDRNRELLESQRQLASSSTELGEKYSFLAKKNKEYAETAALSIVQTSELTAKVAQLAARTAQPERLDKTVKSLLDLGAARGLNSQELITVTNQIITGQDEAYKKLGIKNPQILFKEYAEKQGRSTESLSQLERQRVYQDEIIKKAQLFSGAAKTRLESVDGQIARTTAHWENMLDSLSSKFSSSRGVFEFISGVDEALKALGFTLDDITLKLSQGATPAGIADEQTKGVGFYGGLKKIAAVLAGITAAGEGVFNIATGQFTQEQRDATAKKYNSVPEKAPFTFSYAELSGRNDADYEEELIRRNNAALRFSKIQEKVAEEQRKRIEEQDRDEDVRRKGSILDKTFENVVKRKKFDVDAITKAYNDLVDQSKFDISGIYFSTDKVEANAFKYAEAVSNAIAHSYEVTLRNPKTNLAGLQKGLVGIKGEGKLTEDDQTRLVSQFETQIENMIKKVESLKDSVRADLTGSFGKDNPFVKLFSDIETAADRAQKKYGEFGPGFVAMMANIEKAQLRVELGQTRFLNNLKALDFEQQFKALKELPATKTDGFERNLKFVEDRVKSVSGIFDIDKQLRDVDRFNKTVDRLTTLDKLKNSPKQLEKYQNDIELKDTKQVIKDAYAFIELSRKINIEGTGVLGRGVIAEELLKRIPSTEQLAEIRAKFGGQVNVRGLVGERGRDLADVRLAEQAKFEELVENQRVAERTRRFAQEKVNLVNSAGLDKESKAFLAQQILAITGELGNGELTGSLRNSRLQAQQIVAEDVRRKEAEATERMKTITTTLTDIKNALTTTGIKLDTATTPLVDVKISNTATNATSAVRPGPDDVENRSGL